MVSFVYDLILFNSTKLIDASFVLLFHIYASSKREELNGYANIHCFAWEKKSTFGARFQAQKRADGWQLPGLAQAYKKS